MIATGFIYLVSFPNVSGVLGATLSEVLDDLDGDILWGYISSNKIQDLCFLSRFFLGVSENEAYLQSMTF